MNALVLVSLFGGIGTALRYGAGLFAKHHFGESLPYATFAVNVIGSFALALLAASVAERQWLGVELRLVLGTGLLGGFTTYSSFNYEALALAHEGRVAYAAAYVALTLVSCLAGGAVGMALGRSVG